MPLYLDEIYFNIASKDDSKKVYDLINGALTRGFPPGVTLKAGPWISNEEPKIVLGPRHSGSRVDLPGLHRRDRAGRRHQAAARANRRLERVREIRQGRLIRAGLQIHEWC